MSAVVRTLEQERGAALIAARDALERWLDRYPQFSLTITHEQQLALVDLIATSMQAYRATP